MESSYFLILAILLGCLATTVPVFMALFFTGTVGLVYLLGIEYPILSAGMGPSLIGEKTGAPVELVVAVSEAGGLGVLGGAGYTVEELRDEIRRHQAAPTRKGLQQHQRQAFEQGGQYENMRLLEDICQFDLGHRAMHGYPPGTQLRSQRQAFGFLGSTAPAHQIQMPVRGVNR